MLRKPLTGLAALTALAGGAVAGRAFAKDMAAARARLAGRSQVLESPWGAIEYAEAGGGTPLVMIHGSGGGFDQGLAFAAPLTEHGFRVIAPSRFGYLRSEAPKDPSPEQQADAIAWLMEQLGVESAIVCGGSAGALSAMQLAIRHPRRCRALALVVPASYAPDRAADTRAFAGPAGAMAMKAALGSDFVFWAASKAAPDFMTLTILATDPKVVRRASAEEQARAAAVLSEILPVSARAKGLALDWEIVGAAPAYPVEQIACPTLVASVRDDLYGTAKAAVWLAGRIPGAELVLYDTGGHLWIGHHYELWNTVARFAHAAEARPRPRPPASRRPRSARPRPSRREARP